MTHLTCNLCDGQTPREQLETAAVPSNVRAFQAESFVYDRCAHCHSLHARDTVDLAHYYAQYPYHDLPNDFTLRALYRNYLRRLRRAGLAQSARILDFGCGWGYLVHYLRSQGYAVNGYDEYTEAFSDKRVLDQRYDCIISQDVLEHVPDPHALLALFARLLNPGGIVALGTPDATSVDLRRPRDFLHVVHAPYHRHILSREALLKAGARHGWKLERFYPTMYSNTGLPFLNERFYLYYTNLIDGTIDSLLEPLRFGRLLLHAHRTFFWALFGSMLSRNTDVAAIFRSA